MLIFLLKLSTFLLRTLTSHFKTFTFSFKTSTSYFKTLTFSLRTLTARLRTYTAWLQTPTFLFQLLICCYAMGYIQQTVSKGRFTNSIGLIYYQYFMAAYFLSPKKYKKKTCGKRVNKPQQVNASPVKKKRIISTLGTRLVPQIDTYII